MSLIYNFSIKLYYLAIAIASIFNEKAKLWIKGRKKIFEKLEHDFKNNNNVIWIHCASLGEFEQGRPLIESIKKKHKEYKILLTFFSPSGYEIRKNYNLADWVYYLPIDTQKNAKKFIKITKPNMVIFVKYEFWFNFLNQLNINKVPTYLISANFRSNQVFFKSYGKWYRNILKLFNHIFVQNENSKMLLNNVNINKVTISGDTRFDRVYEISQSVNKNDVIYNFSKDSNIFIAGSTWPEDEDLLCQFINLKPKNWKFIIAPHEIHNSRIKFLEAKLKVKHIRYSKIETSTSNNFDVIIIDNIGMLSSLYSYGKIAYIGGGFGKGIHNILEAAVFGLPIIFGPNYKKFKEAIDLHSISGAFSICNNSEFIHIANKLINDSNLLSKTSEISSTFVTNNLGATDKIISKIFS